MSGPAATESLAFDAVRGWADAAMRLAADMAADGVGATDKGTPFDLLTPADAAIERYLRVQIRERFPDHGFLGEEEGDAPGPTSWRWVVDPIDGTLNYVTGLPGAACSIALLHDGDPVVGAIADFSSGRVFRSRSGSGVILSSDGKVEAERRPSRSPVGAARIFIEWGWEGVDPVMAGTIAALGEDRSRVLRIVGGAAYALLSVALHGGCFLGIDLRIWDIAAGVVLAREAGLEVRIWDEGASTHVIAGSADDVRELAPIVERFGSRAEVAAV